MAREAPNLDGWSAYCADCGIAHPVLRSRARDLRTGEIYHEYTCSKCFTPILTIHRTDPAEREQPDPKDDPVLASIKHFL